MTSDPKASRTALVVLLRAKRGGMSASEKAKRKKPAKWLYPWATEHRYAQSYRAWVKPVREFVHQFLAKHQEAILNGDSKDAVIRTDAVAGESFALMVQSLNGWVNAYISDDEDKKLQSPIYMGLGDIADSAFDFNGRQYDKSMKSAIGISFPDDESWWPEAREMWQDSNYETIRSDIKKYIADINTATEQAVTNGWSVKALADKIIALDTKITKSRANFIARDQIGKLNGTITQKRMQDAGLSMYVWDTSGDERVRESHAVMEGLLCRWDDATVCSYDGGRTWVPRPAGAVLMHPGMDYQCRCCADAYFNELLDEADGVESFRAETELEDFSANDFHQSYQTSKEKANIDNFVQYLNEAENADNSVLQLYKSMGKLSKEKGFKMSVVHDTEHKVNYDTLRNSFTIHLPKIRNKNDIESISVWLHENFHVLDFLHTKNTLTTEYIPFSTEFKGLKEAVAKTDGAVSHKIEKLLRSEQQIRDNAKIDFSKKWQKTVEKIWKDDKIEPTEKREALKRAKKEFEKLSKIHQDSEIAPLRQLSDIYSALNRGKSLGGLIKWGHLPSYYADDNNVLMEIAAQYASLSVIKPEYVALLREDKPKLVKALDAMVKAMGEK